MKILLFIITIVSFTNSTFAQEWLTNIDEAQKIALE